MDKAAAKNYPLAYADLGYFHQHGIGTKKDLAAAFRCYEAGAEAGISKAQVGLAEAYEKGIGTKKDRKLALAWYQKAASQGERKALLWMKRQKDVIPEDTPD
jgi:TPR repeat protein